MGKSRKKPNVEVEAALVSVQPTKAAKKDKRNVEDPPEERASSKKQKVETEQVDQNKKKVKKLKKALIESPGDKKDEGRSSDLEGGFAAAPIAVPPMKAAAKGKRGAEEATEKQKSGAFKTKPVTKKSDLNDASSKSDSKEEDGKPVKSKPKAAIAVSKKKADSSDSSSESDLGEEIKKKAFSVPKAPASEPTKKPESSDSSSGCYSDVASKETDNKGKDSLPNDDAKSKEISKIFVKEPEFPAKRNEESGMKRLFVGNLPSEVIKDDLLEFFEKAGEVTEVCLAVKEDGSFRGFGHVEFVTEADAREARRMNGDMLLGRSLIVDWARERGSNNPHEGKENGSYRIGAQDPGHSVYVKGFGKSLEEGQIRKLLKEHFGSYGEIIRVSIPQDKKTGRSKGFAYVLFNDRATVSKALELNGTELGGYTLTVQEPAPNSGPRDGLHGGGRGRGGRLVGQGQGRDGGGRGRGRVGWGTEASYNRSVTTASKGLPSYI